jgi:hypothetical protein
VDLHVASVFGDFAGADLDVPVLQAGVGLNTSPITFVGALVLGRRG